MQWGLYLLTLMWGTIWLLPLSAMPGKISAFPETFSGENNDGLSIFNQENAVKGHNNHKGKFGRQNRRNKRSFGVGGGFGVGGVRGGFGVGGGSSDQEVCLTSSCENKCRSFFSVRTDYYRCYCDPLCSRYKDCCVDYVTNCQPSHVNSTDKPVQIPEYNYKCLTVISGIWTKIGIRMIATCPHQELKMKCEKQVPDTLAELIPIEAGGYIFKNIYCFRCNQEDMNINNTEISVWNTDFKCKNETLAYDLYVNEGPDAVVEYARNSDDCTIRTWHRTMNYHQCEPSDIDKCNNSLSTTENFASLQTQCSSYAAKVWSKTDTNVTFRNVDCALCNGYEVNDTTPCYKGETKAQTSGNNLPNFKILMDFTGTSSNYEVSIDKCPTGNTKNSEGTCSRMQCPAGFKLTFTPRDAYCKKMSTANAGSNIIKYGNESNVYYLKFYYNTSQSDDILIVNTDVLLKRRAELNMTFNSAEVCALTKDGLRCIIVKVYTPLQAESLVTSLKKFEKFFDWRHTLQRISLQNNNPGIATTTMCDRDSRFVTTKKNVTSDWNVVSQDINVPQNYSIYYKVLMFLNSFDDIDKQVVLSTCKPILSCPWVVLKKDQYILINNTLSLFRGSKIVPKAEFWADNGTVKLCVRALQTNDSLVESSLESMVQSYLTLAGQTLSMLSLLLTLLVYSLLPGLRTLPGQGIMNLCVALFLAQLLLQVSGVARKHHIICYIVGVGQHFFWLVSFCWMNSLSQNIAKTFGKSKIVKGGNPTIRPYFAYSWITPALLVTICVVLDLNDHYHIGYGHLDICWIQNLKARLYFFGVPLAVLLFCNMVMFGISVVGLYKSTKTTKKAKTSEENRKANKNLLVTYIKMCSIMGFTWIFGFLANLNDYLWYVFIVLNSCLGVYIFLAFVCTRRVVSMIGTKFGIPCLVVSPPSQTGTSKLSNSGSTVPSISSKI